jgi:effector-binding domain-containing protein
MTLVNDIRPGECTVVTVERQIAAVIEANVAMDEIARTQRALRARLAAALPSLGAGTVGRSVTVWRMPAGGRLDLHPGVLVSRDFAAAGEVVPAQLPSGRAAHMRLVGPFELLPGAWNKLLTWCAKEKLKLAGLNWEIYGETSPDPARQETALYALLA